MLLHSRAVDRIWSAKLHRSIDSKPSSILAILGLKPTQNQWETLRLGLDVSHTYPVNHMPSCTPAKPNLSTGVIFSITRVGLYSVVPALELHNHLRSVRTSISSS